MTDWAHIVQQNGPVVWNTVFRMVGNHTDAADCFQETFVSALGVDRKQPIRNWPALLKRLAVMRSLECLRRRYRVSERSTKPLISPPIDRRMPEPEASMQNREFAEQLRRAVAELDPRQAEVFCLADVDEIPYRQIAELLDITVNHVGVLLHRARSALRERLQEFNPSRDPAMPDREVSS